MPVTVSASLSPMIALVERSEDRHEERRERAHGDAEPHAVRRAADHEHHAGNDRESEDQLARVEATPHQERFDERK